MEKTSLAWRRQGKVDISGEKDYNNKGKPIIDFGGIKR